MNTLLIYVSRYQLLLSSVIIFYDFFYLINPILFFNSKSNCVRSNYPFFVFKNKQNTSIPELDAVYNLEVNQFYFVECLFESFYKSGDFQLTMHPINPINNALNNLN